MNFKEAHEVKQIIVTLFTITPSHPRSIHAELFIVIAFSPVVLRRGIAACWVLVAIWAM
jgi:hypothetical protein